MSRGPRSKGSELNQNWYVSTDFNELPYMKLQGIRVVT
jgi:hypothetical protein